MDNTLQRLVLKYNQPVPRYTSYPTVPHWQPQASSAPWQQLFASAWQQHGSEGISLYVHLPFCESLCTYCGCNKKITTNHGVEGQYIQALRREWEMYKSHMTTPPLIKAIHFGGGTPTFFSTQHLEAIVTMLLQNTRQAPDAQFSIEAHPNHTTAQQLRVLAALGFNRISFGVQDNHPVVQRAINRVQPFANVQHATAMARAAGFTSINFDLIYGLPFQTVPSIQKTFEDVVSLRPDRVAFYSYAHVPWTSKAQRLFSEDDLPRHSQKLQLYITGRQWLLQAGYTDIGMDHFALPGDELTLAKETGTLTRNFMGYTTQHTPLLIGLGVSSISDLAIAYGQNHKTLHNYYHAIEQGNLPIHRGCVLTPADKQVQQHIKNLGCHGGTSFKPSEAGWLQQYIFPHLAPLAADGLVTYNHQGCQVTRQGWYFIRNICSAFDMYLHRQQNGSPLYSMAV